MKASRPLAGFAMNRRVVDDAVHLAAEKLEAELPDPYVLGEDDRAELREVIVKYLKRRGITEK